MTSEEQGNEVKDEPGKSHLERVPQSRSGEELHLVGHRNDHVDLIGARRACNDVFSVIQRQS